MSEEYRNIYKTARRAAGLTQEAAAEKATQNEMIRDLIVRGLGTLNLENEDTKTEQSA